MSSLKYILTAGFTVFFAMLFNFFENTESDYSERKFYKWQIPEDSIKKDSSKYKKSRFPTYTQKDRYGDPFSNKMSRSRLIYGGEPTLLKRDIQFVPSKDSNQSNYFIINEKIGNTNYRQPTLIKENQLNELKEEEVQEEFWKESASEKNADNALTGKKLIPNIPIQGLKKIFGSNFVEFKPTGFINMDFGMQFQRVSNPSLSIRQQRNTTFQFDPHANINLIAKVGEKLKITGNFDTKASFDFENNFKVEYTGFEEEIIQKLEFGNVSFPLTTTLIQGAQNLFGVTGKFQFGKLSVRAIFSNQRAKADQITIQGQNGAQRKNFEIRGNDYEDNRHFFLSQFFRDKYESALSTLPVITSRVTITRMEVYITNRVNNTETLRNIAAFLDLGESNKARKPTNAFIGPVINNAPASNEANQLLKNVQGSAARNPDDASNVLTGTFGLVKGEDFEVIRAARKLNEREYTFQPELGYISLVTPLRNDEVLGIAYEYTFNGRKYKVGELSEDYQTFSADKVIFLKMLRPSSIRLDLPTWNLMMKNIYPLNATQISQQNFQLRVIYRDDLTGIDNPSLQEGTKTRDVPLLQLLGLDRLNQRNDPQQDGNFDYVEGVTIDSRNGRIIFPVLEPFGRYLKSQFNPVTELSLIQKYVYDTLYAGTKADALQASDKNKFFLKGSYEATVGSDITLPGLNIAEGSVRVTAGGIPLVENNDYTVDYATGRVTVINESVLASGKDIKIDYEKADLFNFQVRRLWGARLDYKFSKNLNFGATIMSLSERPVITRTATNEEPTSNTIWGFDINYDKPESRFLTRLVDKIPFIQTKEKSSINFYGEFAQLRPGASPLSGQVSYIDDFEGTRTAFNLVRAPQINWKLGSTPQLFAEGSLGQNNLAYTYNRAKLSWYNIDNVFYRDSGFGKPSNISNEDLANHYVRAVRPQEIFQNRQQLQLNTNELIFDMSFFPNERGPYNFNADLDPNGFLKNPLRSWASITRAITSDVDFDNANIEYIEFWLLDPFLPGQNGRVLDGVFNANNTTGGDLYINLGQISEDVMKDGKHAFENGLTITGANSANSDENAWGRVTKQQFLTNAFDNTGGARENQDIGLDGLKSGEESSYYANFIQNLPGNLNPAARQQISDDASADDFGYYLGAGYDAANAKVLERYKKYNGLENNSPITGAGSNFTASSSNVPDNEDLNTDNTINDIESYYQYKLSIRPTDLQVGRNHIIDRVEANINGELVSWYQFRIPIRQPDQNIGNINGFKSIRFLRMFMTNFQQPVVMRFAQYQLVANQWRRYQYDLFEKSFGLPPEPYDPKFEVSTVNIEENGPPTPSGQTPYVLPPGVIRDRDVTQINNRQINEQSLRLCVTDLQNKDSRAAFKNFNLDLLSYQRVAMYIHAESDNAQNDEVAGFVRLGTDFTNNYYEIEIPLKITPQGTSAVNPELIWPDDNSIDIALSELVTTKTERNNVRGIKVNINIPYTRIVGKYKITVVGNPDLSSMQTSMIGIRNPDNGFGDDKLPKSVCIWANELRITGFDQTAGWSALARTTIKLADFAQITGSVKYTTFGFGALQQKISQRTRANTFEFDISANIALDKFLPSRWNFRLPLFVSYENRNISPRYNPLDPDVVLDNYVQAFKTEQERKDYKAIVEENFTRKSFNFTNVRKEKTDPTKKRFFDIANFSASFAFSEERKSNMTTASYLYRSYQGSLTYSFAPQFKPFEPFKNAKFLKSNWLALLRDFNFNYLPSSILIRGDINRTFARTDYRGADLTTKGVKPIFEKLFTFNRLYDVQWAFTKNLNFSYSANANAYIDEPFGELNSKEKRDSVLNNVLKLGRMKNFNQLLNFTYKIPFDKIPITEFISANISYNISYNWQAGSLGVADTMGNIIKNSRDRNLNGRIDMIRLYSKIGFLKKIDSPPNKNPNVDTKIDTAAKKKPELNMNLMRAIIRPLLFIRSITATYSLQEQTQLSGFKPTPTYAGMDSSFSSPGFDFIFGSQGADIRYKAAENGWLAKSQYLNSPFSQNQIENLTVRASLEPIPDFRVTVDFTRKITSGYQEIFRFNDTTQTYQSLNPIRTGSYSTSFLSLATSFVAADNQLNESPIFRQFEQNRAIILARLKSVNGNAGEYALNSQDVLIPAFIAAYSGNDPNKVSLSPFPNIPLPNWRLDYTGLTRIPFIKKYFSAITISHAYNSLYSVGTYTSSLEYNDPSLLGVSNTFTDYAVPSRVNAQNEFIAVNVINQISIIERFSPLVGFNIRTRKNLTLKMDYNWERNLNFNLSNGQLAETRSQDIIIGIGYNKRGMRVPFFKRDGNPIILKNDFTFRLDFTMRNSKTIQRKLDDVNTITAGNLNLQIKPIIGYAANQRLNLQMYFEYTVNTPYVSSSFPRTNVSFGIQVRFNLSE